MTQFEMAALLVASVLAPVLFASIITSDRTWEAFVAWLGRLFKGRPAKVTPEPAAPPKAEPAVTRMPWLLFHKLARSDDWEGSKKKGKRATRKEERVAKRNGRRRNPRFLKRRARRLARKIAYASSASAN